MILIVALQKINCPEDQMSPKQTVEYSTFGDRFVLNYILKV